MCDAPAPEKTIKFYTAQAAYGFLSNFSRHSVKINGVTWPTVEHWFQAQKFAGTPAEESIRNASTPALAKKLGSNRNSPFGALRSDWANVKEDIMYTGLVTKFTQHPKLASKLLATGDALLVEHTNDDSYWGDGGNGRGKNRLGVLLQRVRSEIRSNPTLIQNNTETRGSDDEKSEKTETSGAHDDNEDTEDSNDEDDDIDVTNNDDDIEANSNHSADLPATAVRSPNKRSVRNKGRRNVWKDGAGRSLFEIDSAAPGQVSLVADSNITIPISALPSAAKYVVKRNQFSRRSDANEGEVDEMNNENDDIDYNYNSQTHNRTLGDYFGVTPHVTSSVQSPVPQDQPEYLESPNKCLETARANLELYHLLDVSDPSRAQVVSNLSHVRNAIIHFISQSEHGEDTMNQLLTQLSVVNEVVGEA